MLLQGTPRFSLPVGAAGLAAAHPARVALVGSLTARPDAAPPFEAGALFGAEALDASSGGLALVAFGTHALPCPLELLRGLELAGLAGAIVLIPSCEGETALPAGHAVPASRDQAAWLQVAGLRLAVVHGGLHSLHEVVAVGLPIACVPHKGDQWANCRDVQRQRLGWAVHPHAEGEEAAAVFNMLLGNDGGPAADSSAAAAAAQAALAEAGGAAGAVRHVEALVQTAGSRSGPAGLTPFFAAPFRWLEAWLLAVPVLSVALAVLGRCLPTLAQAFH